MKELITKNADGTFTYDFEKFFTMDEYNEFLEFATSDESSTSVRILETEMITE